MANHIAPLTAADPSSAFLRLLTVLDTLRTECPWDKKQTMETLRHLTIEETYELSDAILDGDLSEVKKELGDVMMHLVFYARIASETNDFTIVDVLNSVCDKLINRHPHIYGDVEVQDENDVKRNWEQIKLKEGNKSVLGGVPASLPALVKASRIQEKSRGNWFLTGENKNSGLGKKWKKNFRNSKMNTMSSIIRQLILIKQNLNSGT